MSSSSSKKPIFKYLLYFLILIMAGSIIYKNTSNELTLKVSNISLIPNNNSCKVLFNVRNLTKNKLSAAIKINVVLYSDNKTGAEANILGSKEIEVSLLPHESKKIQEVVKIINHPSPIFPAGNKRAEVYIIKVDTQINQH